MRKADHRAALSLLLLASCARQEPTIAENVTANGQANVPENANPSIAGQPEALANGTTDGVPPPDAVSHPDGYLPNATDVPTASGTEPTAGEPAGSKPPPVTEDEYIRNKQQ